jgi:hypothetical protein
LDSGAITFAAIFFHLDFAVLAPSPFSRFGSCLKNYPPLERRETEISFNFSLVKAKLILVKPVIMKHPSVYNLSAIAVALFLWTNQTSARPIGFSEISLLVRAHESEASVKEEVTQRKLLHALSPTQENILKSQGASDSLIQSLRNSNLVASKEEAAASEAAAVRNANPPLTEGPVRENGHSHVFVFDVAYGHPVNLSQWGGLDYEIAFYSYRFAGEDHVQPAFIDNILTRTEVSRNIPLASEGETFTQDWFPTNGVRNWRFTPYDGRGYDGRGDFRDTRSFNFSDSVAVSSYSVSRPVAIDWRNPVFIDGQPYTFYPVYGAGGISLYYICSSGDSVKLAVSTANQ